MTIKYSDRNLSFQLQLLFPFDSIYFSTITFASFELLFPTIKYVSVMVKISRRFFFLFPPSVALGKALHVNCYMTACKVHTLNMIRLFYHLQLKRCNYLSGCNLMLWHPSNCSTEITLIYTLAGEMYEKFKSLPKKPETQK